MFIGNTRVGVDNNFVEKISFIILCTKEQLFNEFGLYPMVLFTHRIFNNELPSEKIYNEYFKDRNWTRFNLDQIVLQNNTMHWYLY